MASWFNIKVMTPVGEEHELSFWRRSRRLDPLIARYVVVLATVLGIVVVTFALLSKLDAETRASYMARYNARQLFHLQSDEDVGLRGFAAMGKPSYWQPYVAARRSLESDLAALRTAVTQPEVLHELEEFEKQHRVWEQSVAAPILHGASDGLNGDRQRIDKRLLTEMQSDTAQIDKYYASRADEIDRARAFIRYGSYALILFTILGVATFGYVSERTRADREERLLRSVLSQRDTMTRQSEWRTKIIAILAHDFRTSLSVIQANAELLETHPGTHLRSNAFRAIYRGIADLSSMTDEALLMARVANDTLVITPEPVFVYDLVAEVADRFSERQDIRVTLSDEYVMGDERYLARVFDNLISNAVKYSNGPIDVGIAAREKMVEIDVTDRGPGIDAADLPHVFEEYWRAESVAGKRGSGIGLYIVKKIVDAHHGAVQIESSAGEGTTVRVTLPRGCYSRTAAG